MENEPQRVGFRIEIFGKELICTPQNTYAYLYEDTRFDHLFYVTEHQANGNMAGYHIWRCMLDSQFDDTVRYMIANNFEVESLIEPEENDKNAFFKRYPNEPYELPKLLEYKELTPRQERRVAYLGYLLTNGYMTPDEFKNEGEVVI